MGIYANFYNSIGDDRVYDASSMEEWLRPFFKNGVFQDELQVVSDDGMNITVKSGNAFINGKMKCFESDIPLTVEAAHATLDRIDNVVVRRNDTERDFSILIEKGSFSSQPVAPTPTRSSGIYDLVIAQIYVHAAAIEITTSDISDTRPNADLCGWVMATVNEIDISQIMAQNKSQFEEWFATIQDVLDGDTAGHLQNEITELQGYVSQTVSLSLNASDWNSNQYTIQDLKIVTSKNITLSYPVAITDDQYEALSNASIRATAISNGSLTLTASGEVPTMDLPIELIIWR